MSRFATPTPAKPQVKNLAGGKAYAQSPELELVSLLLTSFAKDKAYESADQNVARLKALVQAIPDKQFVAKAALYARNEHGIRTVTHIVAGELAYFVRGEGSAWVTRYLNKAVHRADDITEILGYYLSTYGKKKLTNNLRKGLGLALSRLDKYALAKYKGLGKKPNMIDAVNLLHPKATPALSALMKGELEAPETWEVKLSQAGKSEDKGAAKAEAWGEMLATRKLGYFALLRNLRNILQQAPGVVPLACAMLVDEKLIRKSLVLPFRFLTAFKELEKEPNAGPILKALSQAVETSLVNIPRLEGKTLIAVDASGSMRGTAIEHASVFAAMLYKTQDADLMTFGDDAAYLSLNPADSVLTLSKGLANANKGGTSFASVFQKAKAIYDRFIILSDQEAWEQTEVSSVYAKAYAKRKGGEAPSIFAWDLAGDGKMQFPEEKTCVLAGLSDKVFDLLQGIEENKDELLDTIRAIEL